jgi:glycosyltransferase involved in cell wall biosynthesis
VLKQNYPNFEHIIIDGGSTDGTVEILKQYPHLKWISEPDEGQSDALNKGFKMAEGDIIGWLNADDYYTENVFFKVAEVFKINSNIDAVYSNFYVQYFKNNDLTKKFSHLPIKFLALFHCYIPSTTFFFKSKIISIKGVSIDKNLDIAMDKDFFAKIIYSGNKIKYINDFFAVFRWHSNNKSLDSPITKKKLIDEGIKIYNRYSKIRLPENNIGKQIYYMVGTLLLGVRKILKINSVFNYYVNNYVKSSI